ncbi:hypothetical protein MAHJHV28_45700 [Mycobacterium avium subsp. hominissuis]
MAGTAGDPPMPLAVPAKPVGGSPAVGTSEESTAGGVFTLYGQFAGRGFLGGPHRR